MSNSETAAATMSIPVGTRVIVRHENGTEEATVLWATKPRQGEQITYTVRFDDLAVTTFPAMRIAAVQA